MLNGFSYLEIVLMVYIYWLVTWLVIIPIPWDMFDCTKFTGACVMKDKIQWCSLLVSKFYQHMWWFRCWCLMFFCLINKKYKNNRYTIEHKLTIIILNNIDIRVFFWAFVWLEWNIWLHNLERQNQRDAYNL